MVNTKKDIKETIDNQTVSHFKKGYDDLVDAIWFSKWSKEKQVDPNQITMEMDKYENKLIENKKHNI